MRLLALQHLAFQTFLVSGYIFTDALETTDRNCWGLFVLGAGPSWELSDILWKQFGVPASKVLS